MNKPGLFAVQAAVRGVHLLPRGELRRQALVRVRWRLLTGDGRAVCLAPPLHPALVPAGEGYVFNGLDNEERVMRRYEAIFDTDLDPTLL